MHLGKKFLAATFSVIVNCDQFSEFGKEAARDTLLKIFAREKETFVTLLEGTRTFVFAFEVPSRETAASEAFRKV